MEEDTGKSTARRRPTGRIHGADYSLVDYNRAGIPLIEIVTKPIVGAGEQAPEVARAYVAHAARAARAASASPTCGWTRARCAATSTCRSHRPGTGGARHPHRDQERQLAALGRAGGPLRDQPPGGRARRRRRDRAGDPALARGHRRHHVGPREVRRRGLPLLPRARPGAGRAEPRVGRGAAGDAARAARRTTGAAAGRLGLHRPRDARRRRRRCARAGRGRPSPPVPRRQAARKWWLSRARPPRQRAGRRARRAADHARRRSPASRRSSTTGSINDKLARQVLDGVLAGEGTPDEVVAARGLAVVSDDGALAEAVDGAIAANPDVAAEDPRRQGRPRPAPSSAP